MITCSKNNRNVFTLVVGRIIMGQHLPDPPFENGFIIIVIYIRGGRDRVRHKFLYAPQTSSEMTQSGTLTYLQVTCSSLSRVLLGPSMQWPKSIRKYISNKSKIIEFWLVPPVTTTAFILRFWNGPFAKLEDNHRMKSQSPDMVNHILSRDCQFVPASQIQFPVPRQKLKLRRPQ